jgi:hypothetical protein
VADVPSGLSLTPPKDTKKKKLDCQELVLQRHTDPVGTLPNKARQITEAISPIRHLCKKAFSPFFNICYTLSNTDILSV